MHTAVPLQARNSWLFYAIITTVTWGVWGALIEVPEKAGFPATLGYAVWALTMIPCALVVLTANGFRLEHDKRSVALGLLIGLTGAGGQLILFEALRLGPAYLIFPIVSLYPLLTVILSVIFLRERASRIQWCGIVLALAAILLLSWSTPDGSAIPGYAWLWLAMLVFVLWGVQALFMKAANNVMHADSIFVYMALSGLLVIPAAVAMTDFSQPINWGFRGPGLAALIQILNAIGALFLVYAMRYGKALIVAPMTSLSPMITVVLSLVLYAVIPNPAMIVGFVLATIAIYLFAK